MNRKKAKSFIRENPATKFETFESPEYQDYEHRGLMVGMTRLYPENDTWEYLWGYYSGDPVETEVELGIANENQAAVEFEDGLYHYTLKYKESIRFGDMRIRRVSKVARVIKIENQ